MSKKMNDGGIAVLARIIARRLRPPRPEEVYPRVSLQLAASSFRRIANGIEAVRGGDAELSTLDDFIVEAHAQAIEATRQADKYANKTVVVLTDEKP